MITKSILSYPKPRKWRSPAYRKWIAQQRCCVCGCMPTQATHQNVLNDKGMGSKVSDSCLLPLCALCHHNEHQRGDKSFWAGKDREKLIVHYLVKYVSGKWSSKAIIRIIDDWLARGMK
jgi:hypothetical protein